MRFPIAEIEKKLGYVFQKKGLLERAFVHSSYAKVKGIESNERMEYLGDAVLQLVVTEWQYFRAEDSEGKMTKGRQGLVCQETLLKEVEELGIEQYLLKVGGKENVGAKTVSSLFETVIAAIYLDGGYEPAKKFILKRLSDRDDVNYKGELQEFAQKRGESLPVYVSEKFGKDNAPFFKAIVTVMGKTAEGEGKTIKAAERDAAKKLLLILSKDYN